jgi:imidazolonepropionase-like amidohydrolase
VRSIEHANLVDRETLKYMKEKGAWLSPQELVFKSEIRGLTPDQQAKQRQALDGVDQLMTMAREVGFENIVFGADVVTNLDALAGIGEEFTLHTRWFKPAEILRQANVKGRRTAGALRAARNPYGTLGVIRQGAVADILVLDGDPLEDISVLANPSRNLRLITKDGKIYKNTL